MNEQIERECPVCGTAYYAEADRLRWGRQTTCSRACSYQLRASKRESTEERQCGACAKTIRKSPSQIQKARHGLFCSRACAYRKRRRVVSRPYALSDIDPAVRAAGARKAWETRRRNAKPYPKAARLKNAAHAAKRIAQGGGVSAFERKAAQVFRLLGFGVATGVSVRRSNGTHQAVFDIVIGARRLAVECHGTFWHGARWTWQTAAEVQARNLRYEERKTVLARDIGLDLRLLWEHDFKKDPVGACLAAVR